MIILIPALITDLVHTITVYPAKKYVYTVKDLSIFSGNNTMSVT